MRYITARRNYKAVIVSSIVNSISRAGSSTKNVVCQATSDTLHPDPLDTSHGQGADNPINLNLPIPELERLARSNPLSTRFSLLGTRDDHTDRRGSKFILAGLQRKGGHGISHNQDERIGGWQVGNVDSALRPWSMLSFGVHLLFPTSHQLAPYSSVAQSCITYSIESTPRVSDTRASFASWRTISTVFRTLERAQVSTSSAGSRYRLGDANVADRAERKGIAAFGVQWLMDRTCAKPTGRRNHPVVP